MRICRFLIIVAILVLACPGTRAQFKRDAFTQNYSDLKDTTARKDSIDKMFSFKEFFRGVSEASRSITKTIGNCPSSTVAWAPQWAWVSTTGGALTKRGMNIPGI